MALVVPVEYRIYNTISGQTQRDNNGNVFILEHPSSFTTLSLPLVVFREADMNPVLSS